LEPKVSELLEKEFKVLDHGFVRLIDVMGDDAAIVQAARVSYGKGTKKRYEDRGLIRYLMRHQHTSPFEMVEFKFHVKLPIFVARQWIRHRTANVNEYSGRYSVMEEEFYLPQPEELRVQSETNRQGKSEETLSPAQQAEFLENLKRTCDESYKNYRHIMDAGLAREVARIQLPLNLYTQWYWKIDLHNLLRFLRLRMDSKAQAEIQVYARVIADIVKEAVPLVWEAFEDYQLNSVHLSAPELQALREYLDQADTGKTRLKLLGLDRLERMELRAKLEAIRNLPEPKSED